MSKPHLGSCMFVLAAIAFAFFVANILAGAPLVSGESTPFFNDVSEMLLLLAAVGCFVAGIITREAEKT